MNAIVTKFLLVVDKFMPEIHLRQPGFNYSACGPFTKNKETIWKFKETKDSRYIYQNELDKACFQNDMANGDFKDLPRRAASDKAFNIAKNLKYNGYKKVLASMVYKVFDKKPSSNNTSALVAWSETLATPNKFAGSAVKSEVMLKKKKKLKNYKSY